MSKIWFITGCSRGLGRALTEQLLTSTDACVVATARNPEALKELELQYPGRILVLQLDVTKQSDIRRAVDMAINQFNRIDVLVNNAGYGLTGALEECTMEDIRSIFDTNVFGAIEIIQTVLPYMRKQHEGHILNISSTAGLVAAPGLSVYNSTKFALEGISEGLALDVANFGIKVTIIEPGPFRTDFAGQSAKISPPHPGYQNSAANSIREYISKINHTQPGDPIKAAQIMIKITEMQNPPLRLLLGNLAVERITAKFENQSKEFKQYEELARSADYDMV
jgi:NAD(P)-dependent dehydrogenase (short-subunit alcohol dehydrogenase family)